MAEIIDNVKVGLFIKSLLKEHQMTQDQLAEKLFITKAAVSQNLNGKSAFDIQNLVKIAEIFNITLDDLVAGRRKRSGETDDAEYVKLIRKGLDKFKSYAIKDMNLATPDVYGKVLVDYVMEEKLDDWLRYLLDKEAELVLPHYHRYKQLIMKVVIYALKHECGNPERLIVRFVETFGDLHFVSSFDQDEFFSLLNQKKHENLARSLLSKKVPFQRPIQVFFVTLKQRDMVPILSQSLWLETISRLKLFSFFIIFFDIHIRTYPYPNLEKSIRLLSRYAFFKAITYLIEQLPALKSHQSLFSDSMTVVSYDLAKAKEIELLRLGIQKLYFQDLQNLCLYAIQHDLEMTYHLLLNDYASSLKLKKIAIVLVQSNKIDVLSTFKLLFDKDILSYVLDALAIHHLNHEKLKKLIHIGAEFNPKYTNENTALKMNLLIQEK